MIKITHEVVPTESGQTVVSRLFVDGRFMKAVSKEINEKEGLSEDVIVDVQTKALTPEENIK